MDYYPFNLAHASRKPWLRRWKDILVPAKPDGQGQGEGASSSARIGLPAELGLRVDNVEPNPA